MQAEFLDLGQAAPLRTAWLNPALICLILGLLGALPLVILTPPFQVPDEPQHFLRAYQLSGLQLHADMYEGERRGAMPSEREAKAWLPSSLIELVEFFLGTREVYAGYLIKTQPLQRTWLALDRPLAPEKRELISLPASAKAPLAYLPQAVAIAIGRWLGAGPLALFYLGRIANALAAVAVLAWAVRLMPLGREMMMFFSLLPMAIFEYASVSPDAMVITTAFLFTAVMLGAELRRRWSAGDAVLAAVSGLVFCTQKPVYLPLLLIGLPSAMAPGRARHILFIQAGIIAVVLGGTVAWLWFASSMQSVAEGTSVTRQIAFIAKHPVVYARTMAVALWHAHFWYREAVGFLGWRWVPLPDFAYILPLVGFVFATFAQPSDGPRLPGWMAAWGGLLVAAGVVVIITAAYLLWNPVGSAKLEFVSGRYFLPMLGLAAAGWCSFARVRLTRQGSLAAVLMLFVVIAAQFAITDLTTLKAYQLL